MADKDDIAKEMEKLTIQNNLTDSSKFVMFEHVVNFVEDLFPLFRKNKALSLYKKLLQHIVEADESTKLKGVKYVVKGFIDFFNNNKDNVYNNIERVKRGTIIKYNKSETIYIDIQFFIYKSDDETKEAIRQHLLKIFSVVDSNSGLILDKVATREDKTQIVLDSIDKTTSEGQFIDNIFSEVKSTMEKQNTDNPAVAIMGLFNSGIFTKMKDQIDNGKMDGQKLMNVMQNSMKKLQN